MRKRKNYLLLYFKGVGMGSADVVPGVSGGTVALITGIYEELINSIKSFDVIAVQLLLKFKFAEFWKHINGTFLVVLIAGIVTSLLTFGRIIIYLLANHPIQIWSFFFGLILISAILVAKEVKKWTPGVIVAGIAGIIIAYLITTLSPTETPTALWFIFLSGAVAICAMILPGISGAFILLILGKYEYIIQALHDFNLIVIVIFALGCIIGLLSFSRVVSWLLNNFHGLTIALLGGFMIGSLNKVWPWKIPLSYRLNSHGQQVPVTEENIFPTEYLELSHQNPHVLQAALFMILGILLVIVLEKIGNLYSAKVAAD